MSTKECNLLFVERGIVTTLAGEVVDVTEDYLLSLPARVTVIGHNQFPYWANFIRTLRGREGRDYGWLVSIDKHGMRTTGNRERGIIYVQRLSYRFPKPRGVEVRPPAKVISLLNLERFTESDNLRAAGMAIIDLAERRGITPRFTPGSLGGAMLRASSEWNKDRRPAPFFISDVAREHLPGNHYETRRGYRKVARAFYIDQKSSHHTIASEIDIPHPHHLHRRGERTDGDCRREDQLTPESMRDHVGLFLATITVGHIPAKRLHLYPRWMQEPGHKRQWIWTPETRLFDDRIRVERIHTALTSVHPDPAIREYANWALAERATPHNPAIKPALLAAYGVLAKRSEPMRIYSKGERLRDGGVTVSLPLIGEVNRYDVGGRTPTTQNVVARGVIESETLTRSLELARDLEGQGMRVVHIYADGLIVQTDCLPFLPPFWGVSGALTDVTSPHTNQILSRELIRMPGIPNGRRTAYIRTDSGTARLRATGPIVAGKRGTI